MQPPFAMLAVAVLVKIHNRYRPGTLPGPGPPASGWAGDSPAESLALKLNLAARDRSQVLLHAIEFRADSESIWRSDSMGCGAGPGPEFTLYNYENMANMPMLKRQVIKAAKGGSVGFPSVDNSCTSALPACISSIACCSLIDNLQLDRLLQAREYAYSC